MALTDEEKAELIAQGGTPPADNPADEEAEENADEQPTGDDLTPEELEDEEKPAPQDEGEEGDEPAAPTFTKQFPNLKGDDWESYGSELEKAYQNSFNEALRLNKELEEARRVIAQSPAIQQAGQPQPGAEGQPQNGQPTPPAQVDLSKVPELAAVRSYLQQNMNNAFDKFKTKYPDVLDAENFKKFQAAAQPLGDTFLRLNNREPTYDELFENIATYYGWQPAEHDARKGSALRQAAPARTSTTPKAPPAKGPKVSDAQVDAYMKMFPNKNRAQVVKELEAAIS